MAETEILSDKRYSAYDTSIGGTFAAEHQVPDMIAVPMRRHHVIYLSLWYQPLYVAAHPFTPVAGMIRHRRNILHVFDVVRITAIKKHGRSIREDKERLLPNARMDEVDIKLAEFPLWTGFSDIAARDTACNGSTGRTSSNLQESTTCFHIFSHIQRPINSSATPSVHMSAPMRGRGKQHDSCRPDH